MLATAIIVFREVLEAALIVGIVLAASRGIAASRRLGRGRHRGRRWSARARGGRLAETIAAAAAGIGQEVFNAAILFAAVAMLGWHNVWMTPHGREMATPPTGSAPGCAPAHSRSGRWRWRSGWRCCARARRSCCSSTASPPRRRRRGGDGARRRARIAGGRHRRGGALFRAGQHSAAPPVCGHQLAGSAAGRRHGVAGRRFPAAGRSSAAARQRAVGYLVPADRAQPSRQGPAHADRLYGAARRHPGRVLPRDADRDRRTDAADRAGARLCRRSIAHPERQSQAHPTESRRTAYKKF